MSIFDNIVFDEFTLLEGEQAEAYKKRKAEEKMKKFHDIGRYKDYSQKAIDSKNDKRDDEIKALEIYKKEDDTRSNNHYKKIEDYKNSKKAKEDADHLRKLHKDLGLDSKNPSEKNRQIYAKEERKMRKKPSDYAGKNYENLYLKDTQAIDATARHIRRHPKQYKESVFENIEMI